jgi:hypothetical protein
MHQKSWDHILKSNRGVEPRANHSCFRNKLRDEVPHAIFDCLCSCELDGVGFLAALKKRDLQKFHRLGRIRIRGVEPRAASRVTMFNRTQA